VRPRSRPWSHTCVPSLTLLIPVPKANRVVFHVGLVACRAEVEQLAPARADHHQHGRTLCQHLLGRTRKIFSGLDFFHVHEHPVCAQSGREVITEATRVGGRVIWAIADK